MGLIKIAFKSSDEIKATHHDNRGLWRRAKGKMLTYPLMPLLLPAPILGHYLDRRRQERDFVKDPSDFSKKK